MDSTCSSEELFLSTTKKPTLTVSDCNRLEEFLRNTGMYRYSTIFELTMPVLDCDIVIGHHPQNVPFISLKNSFHV